MKEYATVSRAKILEFLSNNSDRTVSVGDIADYLEHSGHTVNMSTIYRYIDKLVAENRVIKYVSESTHTSVYQFVDQNQHCDEHLHLKCVKCGNIIHLECHFMNEIKEHIMNEHGFKLQCKNSILYGTCADCAAISK